ncbi:MAG TPA: Rrf2 family transcriptional regulator [Candidatus Atribacteria bacterium]|nr:Rrf2 family transcriptional regulator [Candidatus Atribacteria bacterium]HQE25088.1 Rrf2 family transcriptional regulator [Candidatus Atribacteria bacterium]
MKIRFSTRSRYGLRFMIELALFYDSKNLVFLREIAEKEDISEKYLTQLAIPLRARGLISSRRGAGGGYRLSRPPAQITAKEVIEALEGGIFPVDCLENPDLCSRVPFCAARKMWKELQDKISETLEKFTLEDLARMSTDNPRPPLNYSI